MENSRGVWEKAGKKEGGGGDEVELESITSFFRESLQEKGFY